MKNLFKSLICFLLCSCFFVIDVNANTVSVDELNVEIIYVNKNISIDDLKNQVQDVFDTTNADIVNVKYIENLSRNSVMPAGWRENTETFFYYDNFNYATLTVKGYLTQLGSIQYYSSSTTTSGNVSHYSTVHYNQTTTSAYSIIKIQLGTTWPHILTYKAELFGDIYQYEWKFNYIW